MKKYFLNFTEEGIFDPDYFDCAAGRIAVWTDGPYADEEIRFFTKRNKKWNDFRKKWDFKEVTETELVEIIQKVTDEFYISIED